jgi:hypothetical protein
MAGSRCLRVRASVEDGPFGREAREPFCGWFRLCFSSKPNRQCSSKTSGQLGDQSC